LLRALRCGACGHDGLVEAPGALRCPVCARDYVVIGAVPDLAEPEAAPANLTQRLMETRFYARFYEDVMRPRLTSTVTRRTLPQEYELSTAWLDLSESSRVLDVACGTGNFTRAFATAAPGALVVGADLSWSMLEQAEALAHEHGLRDALHFVRLDATQMPVASEAFDRVHCHAALHFMDDPDAALRNFARVLQPGGICVIGTFLQRGNVVTRLSKRVSSWMTGFGWFEKENLRRRMERAGFVVERESVVGDAITVRARKTG
jgi:ubiquinone/menaquinone biosynthesis C-methylase UbiE